MLMNLFDAHRWEQVFSPEVLLSFCKGFLSTLQIAVLGLLLAFVLGVIFGLCSTSKVRILKLISRIYVEFFQNTPIVVQCLFYFAVLPICLKTILNTKRAVRLPKVYIGIMAVGFYHGAYISEVIRTGIESIPKGQTEAALSQGFTSLQTMRLIVIPQTFKVILPPLTNQAVNLIINSSVVAMIAGGDLMYTADIFVTGHDNLVGYLLCAAMYFAICFPLAMLARHLEAKAKEPGGGQKKQKTRG